MKKLIFGTGLMVPTIQGKKKITLRKYREGAHDFSCREAIIGEFKDGLDIPLRIIADTVTKPLSELTDEEAQEDGFENAEDAFNGLKAYYPGLKKEDIVAVIRYNIDAGGADGNKMIVALNQHSE